MKISWQIIEKYWNTKCRENLSFGSQVIPCRQSEGQTDMTTIIVTFRSFANVPKNILCSMWGRMLCEMKFLCQLLSRENIDDSFKARSMCLQQISEWINIEDSFKARSMCLQQISEWINIEDSFKARNMCLQQINEWINIDDNCKYVPVYTGSFWIQKPLS